MSIITLTSDLGIADHYVALVKAAILQELPAAVLVDISHQIPTCHLAQAAFLLGQTIPAFPAKTVHLVAVDTVGTADHFLLAITRDGQFIVCPDNGLLSLLEQEGVGLESVLKIPRKTNDTVSFPERGEMAVVAARLAEGMLPKDLGEASIGHKELRNSPVKTSQNNIKAQVVYVDKDGNLLTNLSAHQFEDIRQGRNFSINIGIDEFRQLQQHYHQVQPGDCAVFFNSSKLLEIAIRYGNAAQLLGMEAGSNVIIRFYP